MVIKNKNMKTKITYYILFVFMLASLNTSAQKKEFKVLSYNALHGFSGDKAIQSQYIKWVKQLDPDVILYQEMNEFTERMIKDFAQMYGHTYSAIINREIGHDVTHPLALSSKYPIEEIERVSERMWHSYIYAKIQGVNMFVTHLAPFTLIDRKKDVKRMLDHAKTFPENEPVLIAGDFNALSAVDSNKYGDVLLTSMRRIEGRLEPKSGTPIVKNKIIYRNNLDNGEIDYSVAKLVSDAGYTDAFYHLNKNFKNSVPTKRFHKKSSKLRRIDYIWLNPTLTEKLIYADIIHDETTHHISDHYPVFVKFIVD